MYTTMQGGNTKDQMPDEDQPETISGSRGFTIQTLLLVVAAVAIGLAPMAYFGWKGVLSTICLTPAAVLIVLGQKRVGIAIIVCLAVGQFFFPAIDGARDAILRSGCSDKLRTLTYALLDYESENGHFPPPFSTSDDGTPLHSWRVLLLPYLGEAQLFEQIDKTRPWDDPVNVPFHDQMPDVFCCDVRQYHSRWRQKGNTTAYVVVVGKTTAWSPSLKTNRHSLTDGSLWTVSIVESENHRIPWMAPHDPTLNSFLAEFKIEESSHAILAMFDGSTHSLGRDFELSEISNLITISGRQ